MMIWLHARHNRMDQARGLFFEMQEWRYSVKMDLGCVWINFFLSTYRKRKLEGKVNRASP